MKNSAQICGIAKRLLVLFVMCCVMIGCASIDVTKTSDQVYPPTDAKDVEFLRVTPYRAYEQLATFEVSGFDQSQTVTMHNAMRIRAATLGADAVILTSESVVPSSMGGHDLVGTGIAIRYTAPQ